MCPPPHPPRPHHHPPGRAQDPAHDPGLLRPLQEYPGLHAADCAQRGPGRLHVWLAATPHLDLTGGPRLLPRPGGGQEDVLTKDPATATLTCYVLQGVSRKIPLQPLWLTLCFVALVPSHCKCDVLLVIVVVVRGVPGLVYHNNRVQAQGWG